MWFRASLVLVGLTSMACATAGTSVRPMTSANRSVITAAEIVSSRVTDPHQAVIQLRPEFLRMRGASVSPSFRPPPVIVYLDERSSGT